MTASTAARTSADQGAERKGPRKAVAFGLAGLVAAAGIAGAVVTSSAYFTDTQTVANNYVKTNSIDLDAQANGGGVIVPAALNGLVPAQTGNVDTLAKEQEFQIKNIGDGSFTWRVNFGTPVLKKSDGTTDLTTSSSSMANGLTATDAKAKLRWQFAVKDGSTWKWSGTFAAAKSLSDSDIAGDELTSAQAGALFTTGGAAVTDLPASGTVPIKIRYWLNSDSNDNWAQNIRYTFPLVFDAQQSL